MAMIALTALAEVFAITRELIDFGSTSRTGSGDSPTFHIEKINPQKDRFDLNPQPGKLTAQSPRHRSYVQAD